MSKNLAGKTVDNARASASELGTVYFHVSLGNISVWTAVRPVATIDYIALIIFDSIKCFLLTYKLINAYFHVSKM